MSTRGVFSEVVRAENPARKQLHLLVVSETPDEIKKITSRHPLGKKLEPMVLTPDEFSSVETKNKELSKSLDSGITLWGSSW